MNKKEQTVNAHNCGCCHCHPQHHEDSHVQADDSGWEDEGEERQHHGCCCQSDNHEEEPLHHDHSHDPELARYKANEKDIMEDEKAIDADERRAFGHLHAQRIHPEKGHAPNCH